MGFHFLGMEKSWKINVEKEGAPRAPWYMLFIKAIVLTLVLH